LKYHFSYYLDGYLGLRIEIKLVISFISIITLFGFTQVPIASADTPNIFEVLSKGDGITFVGAPLDHDIIKEQGNQIALTFITNPSDTSIAICPNTHKLIGGGISEFDIFSSSSLNTAYTFTSEPNFANNSWEVFAELNDFQNRFILTAYAMCERVTLATIVGGLLLEPNTASLILAYGLVNAVWIAPIGIGIGLGIYLVRKKI